MWILLFVKTSESSDRVSCSMDNSPCELIDYYPFLKQGDATSPWLKLGIFKQPEYIRVVFLAYIPIAKARSFTLVFGKTSFLHSSASGGFENYSDVSFVDSRFLDLQILENTALIVTSWRDVRDVTKSNDPESQSSMKFIWLESKFRSTKWLTSIFVLKVKMFDLRIWSAKYRNL